MKSLRAMAVLLAVGAALVGCGDSTDDKPPLKSKTITTTTTTKAAAEVDVSDIESRITTFLGKSANLSGVRVDCPGSIEAEVGATIDCTLSGGAVQGTATATLTDAAGKEFSLVYDYTSGSSLKGNGNATSVP